MTEFRCGRCGAVPQPEDGSCCGLEEWVVRGDAPPAEVARLLRGVPAVPKVRRAAPRSQRLSVRVTAAQRAKLEAAAALMRSPSVGALVQALIDDASPARLERLAAGRERVRRSRPSLPPAASPAGEPLPPAGAGPADFQVVARELGVPVSKARALLALRRVEVVGGRVRRLA